MFSLKNLIVLLVVLGTLESVFCSCENNCSGHGHCSGSTCQCQSPYAGTDCSIFDMQLTSGRQVSSQAVDRMEWKFYHISVPYSPASMTWSVEQTSQFQNADCDLYIRRNNYPTRGTYDYRDITTRSSFSVDMNGVENGVWYAGVYGYHQCGFSIKVQLDGSCPSSCSGHGTCNAGTCSCNSGWSGEACDVQDSEMVLGQYYDATAETGTWRYYFVAASDDWESLDFDMTQPSGQGDCDLYVRVGGRPTMFRYDFANLTTAATSTVRVSEVRSAIYHVGVYGYVGCTYRLRAQKTTPSGPSDCANQCSMHGSCSRSQCECRSAFVGQQCERMVIKLSYASPVHGFAGDNAWNYYTAQDFSSNPLIVNIAQNDAAADCDLYVRRGQDPTRFQYDALDISANQSFNLTIAEPGDDTWHIGVYGWYPCEYTITLLEATTCDCPRGAHGSCPSGTTGCVCNDGWAGDACDIAIGQLTIAAPATGTINFNAWDYYQITVTSSYVAAVVQEVNTQGFVWLFISQTEFPTLQTYDASDQEPNTSVHYATAQFKTVETFTYTIGVYGSPFNAHQVGVPYKLVVWAPQQ
jgi:EGF-like domain